MKNALKIFVVLSLVLTFVVGGTIAANSYRAYTGQTATVDEHGVCKKVTNSAGVDYFIPTNSSAEWQAFMDNAPTGISLAECQYLLANSLRFDGTDDYLSRTPSSAGNRRKWTVSFWAKLSAQNTGQVFFGTYQAENNLGLTYIRMENDNTFVVTGGGNKHFQSAEVFRDPARFIHFVVSWDNDATTPADRLRVWADGIQLTQTLSNSYYPSNGYDYSFNNTVFHTIGRRAYSLTQFFGGYLANVQFIDGQVLTPTSFAETHSSGKWIPKAYSGAYGTNGYYLDFSNGSNLGEDSSGNGNNWTVTSSPTGNVDSPSDNYATLNPLYQKGNYTYSNGNLTYYTGGTNKKTVGSTIATPNTGTWYAEATNMNSNDMVGIYRIDSDFSGVGGDHGPHIQPYGYGYAGWSGQKWNNNSNQGYGATFGGTDVIGVKFDRDTNTVEFFKNGVSQGVAYTNIAEGQYVFGGGNEGGAGGGTWRFDPNSWTHAPAGITDDNALSTGNITGFGQNPSNHFEVLTYTGNGSSQTITGTDWGANEQFVWIKSRTSSHWNEIYDSVRGVGNALSTNSTGVEAFWDGLTSFNNAGFTVKRSGSTAGTNDGANDYVAWRWKAGSSQVSNTAGSITSTVSANTTAGFSIVKYTGTGAVATVGHGLGNKPEIIMVKRLDVANDWHIYNSNDGAGKYLNLNQTRAATNSSHWNSTEPTSTVFSLGAPNQNAVNATGGSYVAYTWSEVEGFSKFGSYTGNGSSDGAFVYTGFSPRFIMVKKSSGTGSWVMYDIERDAANPNTAVLYANSSNAEGNASNMDVLSNGFKARGTSSDINSSGGTYIYMAFAEEPM